MRNNLASLNAESRVDNMGNMFGSMSDIFKQSRDAKATREGILAGMGPLYSPMFGTPIGGRR